MSQFDASDSGKSHLGLYVCWGIILGSMVGLFAGIFWFEMGLSLLFGTAMGLVIGTTIGANFEHRSGMGNSNQNIQSD